MVVVVVCVGVWGGGYELKAKEVRGLDESHEHGQPEVEVEEPELERRVRPAHHPEPSPL